MDYQSFILKYTEIALKGKNRAYFERLLIEGIRRQLSKVEGSFEVSHVHGRAYVTGKDFDFDDTIKTLKKVFGVTGICPAITIGRDALSNLPSKEIIAEKVVAFFGEQYRDRLPLTFKVKCRRVDKTYPHTSMEMDAYLGGELLEAFEEKGLKVDVHNPDVQVYVELREQINIYSEEIKGPGGMPTGTSGRAMLLLSGGIDSPVAGYMIAKRGVEIDAVYFHAPPYTSERAKQKVADLAAVIAEYSGKVRLHVINFTDIQMYIYEKCPHDELTIIMRRYMMRIAQTLAVKSGAIGIVTGESIAQVASQTTHSLMATDEVVTEMPVYRPLIAFDKQDIVDISTSIGTYEISIQPYEDCCTIFVAKHPVTKPRLETIREHEKLLSEKIDKLVKDALETEEIIEIK